MAKNLEEYYLDAGYSTSQVPHYSRSNFSFDSVDRFAPCVKDGAFGSETLNSAFGTTGHGYSQAEVDFFYLEADPGRIRESRFDVFRRNSCIRRAGSATMFIPMNWIEVEHALLHDKEWTGNSNAKAMIEQLLHDPVHGSIGGNGGQMTTFVSPYDPIFFTHHGFLDYVWDYWQREQRNKESLESDNVMVVRKLQNSVEARFKKDKFKQNPAWTERFQANLVADNNAIEDDDAATTTHQEVACVEYVHEHRLPKPCDVADQERITRCISAIQAVDNLTAVPRITNYRSSPSGGVCKNFDANGRCTQFEPVQPIDVCDELNSGIQAMRTSWLNGMGINLEEINPEIAKTNEEDHNALEAADGLFGPTLGEIDPHTDKPWDQCDQTLCFSREKLFEVCAELDAVR